MTIKSARIGIDVGGTFTDAILIDGATGKLYSAKAFTTPKDRSSGVIDAIRAVIAEAGMDPSRISEVVHGSTTGTNALIERTGAKTGLLVTAGFRDVLEIGRVMRPAEGYTTCLWIVRRLWCGAVFASRQGAHRATRRGDRSSR